MFRWLAFFIWCMPFVANAQATARLSEIDLPIVVRLSPLFRLAEQQVDTVFTSPNYPKDWVQPDCVTRYKYHFRRSPLRMQAAGNTLNLQFTGFYQITGATRACVGGTPVSPWTPECSCGFQEPERRVQVGFSAGFRVAANHKLYMSITRNEPKALDKCSVCFWGQDVTGSVLQGLKAELDAAAKAIRDSFGVVDLRPWMQQAWNMMQADYAVPGAGFFNLHPKQIRMEQLKANGDELQIRIGISAAPAVQFTKTTPAAAPVPNFSGPAANDGFAINLQAALQYDSLTRILNGMLAGKRFELSEGLISKHVVVEQAAVGADTSGNLRIQVQFGGSFNGIVYFTGRPVYDAATQSVVVAGLNYELQSRSLLLNTAKWLFNNKIVNELKKRTVFPLSGYYDTARVALNEWLNKEWTKGIRGEGSISELRLASVEALPDHLLVRSQCNGKLVVRVEELNFGF